jgi:hypothetical protein
MQCYGHGFDAHGALQNATAIVATARLITTNVSCGANGNVTGHLGLVGSLTGFSLGLGKGAGVGLGVVTLEEAGAVVSRHLLLEWETAGAGVSIHLALGSLGHGGHLRSG